MTSIAWEVAEIGRLLHAHPLDPILACSALALSASEAERLVAARGIATASFVMPEHAALLLNILVRLEIRCRHDSCALAAAVERPAPELGGQSIGEALRQPTDIERLRQLREAAGTLPLPRVKMWRVPDTYS